MWRTIGLLLLSGLLAASVATNVYLFNELNGARRELTGLRDGLRRAQDERRGLEDRLAQAAAVPAAAAATATGPDRTLFNQIQQQVTELRGLNATQDVQLQFLTQRGLSDYLVNDYRRTSPEPRRQAIQKLLVALGLLAPSADLQSVIFTILQERVDAFYGRPERTVFLIGEQARITARVKHAYAHELVHALQDQRYRLDEYAPLNGNNDVALARRAVIEGDATIVGRIWAQENLSAEEMQELSAVPQSVALQQAPRVVQAESLFPFSFGVRFVQEAGQQGGFAAVNSLYTRPPDSTEQIIHPAKYRSGEKPIAVQLPDLAAAMGQGWTTLDTNTLGELYVNIVLSQFADGARSERAAAGWGGDTWALLEKDGRQALVVRTAWDTELDAREFFDTAGVAFDSRFSGANRVAFDDRRQAVTAPTQATELRINGSEVLWLVSFDRASAEALATAAGF
jgi:hypothetical protein